MTQPPHQNPDPYPEQDPNASSKFGTEGYAPGAFGGPMAEPKKFQTLKMLTLVSLGLYVIGGIIGFIPLFGSEAEQQIREELERQNVTVDDQVIQGSIMIGAAVAGIMLVIGLAVYLLVYFGLRAKKNWARILGIIFAILGIVSTLYSLVIDTEMAFINAAAAVGTVLTIASAAVAIYWLVLAFDGQVKQYLQQR